ncbi:MAG: transcriptional regulator, LacI family [Oscillospiraceae bacterium]|jgi:LacI family transcriptional regulator|nr:transcriptional regulator, LacI family [Oscillospiraceae bacterium]
MKKVSIKDIAQEMNLSRNTVSKALQGSDEVAPHTRERILKKALSMGYAKIPEEIKNEIGGLMLSENKKIAIIAKREICEFWNRIVFGITDVLDKTDYSCMLYFISSEDERDLVLPKEIQNKKVDGIISLSVFSDAYNEKIFECGMPTVFYDAPVHIRHEKFLADVVIVDGYSSVYRLVSELVSKGRKNFGFIGDIHYCRTIRDRWRGFKDALEEHGIPLDLEKCILKHEGVLYYNSESITHWLDELKELPDTVICANDDIAIEVLKYFEGKGFSVPKEKAVAGFDDKLNFIGKNPMLTTVHVDNEYLGKRMLELIMERIQNREKPYETICINTSIIYRHST